jgi:hypothetical protein
MKREYEFHPTEGTGENSRTMTRGGHVQTTNADDGDSTEADAANESELDSSNGIDQTKKRKFEQGQRLKHQKQISETSQTAVEFSYHVDRRLRDLAE